MKTRVVIAVLCSAFIQAQAALKRPAIVPRYSGAEIGEWTMDHDTAFAKAREGTNNVVVMFTGAWWCPDCQVTENTTLTNQAWHAYAATNRLYLVMLDFPGRNNNYTCWLREPTYLADNGLTPEQGEAEITNHYAMQTAYAVPGAATNTFGGYSKVSYTTLIVQRPDGSRIGRFESLRNTTSLEFFMRNMKQVMAADAGDETDDYYQGATSLETPLCEDGVVSGGTHTLSEADVADWYAFDATNGVQWSFAFGATGIGSGALQVRAQIFEYPTNAVSVAERVMTPSDISVLSFVVPHTGRYWLKVSRAQILNELLGYDLTYWYATPPATVLFALPQVSVSDRAPSVTLAVNITGATNDAEVRVSYETVAGSAKPNLDFVPTVGELIWTSGVKRSKTITIPIIPDSVWEGDESFSVVLYSVKNCEVGSQLSTCTVVLKEQTARQPGKLNFEGALSGVLVEGSNALFRVARTAGDNGAITAQVEHVQGTLHTPVGQLVWTNTDVSVKSFTFTFTNEAGFQPDRRSYLKLNPVGGATLLSAAGGTVTLTRRDDLVLQTFAAFAAEPANMPFGYKAARGLWFYGFWSDDERADGWLRSGTLRANDSATLTSTLTGSGVLAFDWQLGGYGATLQCLLGSKAVATQTVAEIEDSITLAVPSGLQTVSWTVQSSPRGTNGFAAVRNLVWHPLPQAFGPSPADKAAVINRARITKGQGALGTVDISRGVRLSWQDVLSTTVFPRGTLKRYELYAGLVNTALVKYAEPTGHFFPQIGNVADEQAFSNLVAKANSRPIYWRVDTVVTDEGGRRAVTLGKTWSVTVLPEGSPEFVAAPEGYDPTVPGGVSLPELTVGVYAAVGPFAVATADGDTVSALVKNGALPVGMKVEPRAGSIWITGAPVRVGAGSADVHLSVSRNVSERNYITVPGSSMTVTWSVRSLGRAAGQFDGFSVQDGVPAYGSAALNVSDVGAVSGKFVHEGLTYAFTAASFGGCTNAGYFANSRALSGTNRVSATVLVWADGSAAEIWLAGVEDRHYVCVRNNWKDAGMAALLNTYVGYYTLALPVVASSSEKAPQGTGYLTVTVLSSGTVKYAGLLADGKSVSGFSTLLYGPDCCSANDRATFYVFSQPSGYGSQGVLCGHIYLDSGEDAVSPKDNTLLLADQSGLHWINPDPKAVFGYDPVTGVLPDGIAGFTNLLDVTGGYYDATVNLQSFYAGQVLKIGTAFAATDDLDGAQGTSGYKLISAPDPSRLPAVASAVSAVAFPRSVVVRNGALVDFDRSTNAWSMTVSPNRATGLFTGSFKLYYQGPDTQGHARQITKPLALNGVFLPLRGPSQTTPSSDWMGFYLVPDKFRYLSLTGVQQSYGFAWSVGFSMAVDQGASE